MKTHLRQRRAASQKFQSGISLIIVMIMVVIVGLTSAAAIRNATSGEKLTNNLRMQNLAQQYAEAALRYCEAQVAMADGTPGKQASLNTGAGSVIPTTAYVVGQATFQTAPHWENPLTWIGVGGASATLTTVPLLNIKSADSSITPPTLPQCVAERQGLPPAGATNALIITARGFSPDYTADAVTGATTGGSVVWLQSILLF
jgi:type IV pilus assembly protein PilX